MKKILLATAGALFFVMPAHAQDDCVVGGVGEDFSAYDTNADCALDDSEFTTVLEQNPERFERYDTNQDGIITEDEFGENEFAEFDRDDDGLLSGEEWGTAWNQDSPLEERGVERAGTEGGEDIIDANQPEQDVIE